MIPERREEAAARGFDARQGDIEGHWPFEADSFDVVHANQVIEHVKSLDHFMEELLRVLRPGGRLVVCTENLASWPNLAALMLGYTPFSITNVSARGALGNPFAVHPGGRPDAPGTSWLHVHVHVLDGLRSLFALYGLRTERTFAAGYLPTYGQPSAWLSHAVPRRAHFIGLVARATA